MKSNEILKGDELDKQRIQDNIEQTDELLKLLVEVYDQKNLAERLNDTKAGLNYPELSRERLNRWAKGQGRSRLCLDERARADIRSKLLPEKPAHWDNPDFTFIDLFAGIGGLRKGFEDVGGRCVFTSEWEQKARRTYLANHYVSEEELDYFLASEEENPDKNSSFMDITNVTLSKRDDLTSAQKRAHICKHIPEHDVLLAGFPCQPFSLAGVSKKISLGRAHGFECDTQGTLFFDVEQILLARQPKFFVLENVKNLKGHDKGNTFATIIRALDRAGYWVSDITDEGDSIEDAIAVVRKRKNEPAIIDGVHFTPQHRERVVLVGIRKDLIETSPELSDFTLKNVDKSQRRYSVGEILCDLTPEEQKKYTLTPNLWNYLYHYALKHQSKGNGFGFGLVDPDNKEAITRTLSARYYKDGSEILINQSNLELGYLAEKRPFAIRKNQEREHYAIGYAEALKQKQSGLSAEAFKVAIKEGEAEYDERFGRYAPEFDSLYKTPRRLTPRECARLMGFEKPEHDREAHDKDFRIVCADSSAYKQFGNSVVVPVFRAVARLLKPVITMVKAEKQSVAA